ncbi:hypothetical protein ACNKHL_21275 [Shigella flexneri]
MANYLLITGFAWVLAIIMMLAGGSGNHELTGCAVSSTPPTITVSATYRTLANGQDSVTQVIKQI